VSARTVPRRTETSLSAMSFTAPTRLRARLRGQSAVPRAIVGPRSFVASTSGGLNRKNQALYHNIRYRLARIWGYLEEPEVRQRLHSAQRFCRFCRHKFLAPSFHHESIGSSLKKSVPLDFKRLLELSRAVREIGPLSESLLRVKPRPLV